MNRLNYGIILTVFMFCLKHFMKKGFEINNEMIYNKSKFHKWVSLFCIIKVNLVKNGNDEN